MNANSEMTEMSQLSDQNIKMTIIKMLQQTTMTMFETNAKKKNKQTERNTRKSSGDIRDIKKNQ